MTFVSMTLSGIPFSISRAIILPFGPDPDSLLYAIPFSLAIFFALGEILILLFSVVSSVLIVFIAVNFSGVAEALISEIALAGAEAGLNESVVSSFFPITATLTRTGTSAPSLKKISSSIPSSGDSRSNEALSVS